MSRSRKSIAIVSSLGIAVAGLGVACSSSSSGAGPVDAGGVDEGGAQEAGGGDAGQPGYPAPHSPMPQAVSLKGPVMTAPKLVTITFKGDALQADIEKFGTELAAAKAYWAGVTAEYGVGPLTLATPIVLDETAPVTIADADVQAWLTAKIQGDGGAFPQPDGNTIYAIYYPDTSAVTMGGGTLCKEFQGYHDDYLLSGTTYVTYAIIGRCKPMGPVPEIDEVSAAAVHEIIEAATDPLPQDKPAYIDVDALGKAWAFVGGGAEIGDLCAGFPDAFYRTSGVTNLVQRVWSNKAAAAGHAPCEPEGAMPYFNSAPVTADTIQVNSPTMGSFKTKGIKIPVGQSKTIDLELYSDAPTSGPWKVSVLDLSSAFFGGPTALSFTMDEKSGQNGDKIKLTIKAEAKTSMGASAFFVQNDLGKQQTFWIGLVEN